MMRAVLDEPDVAAARGATAMHDLSTLHSPPAAGRRISARLAEIGAARLAAADDARRAKVLAERRERPRDIARSLARRILRD